MNHVIKEKRMSEKKYPLYTVGAHVPICFLHHNIGTAIFASVKIIFLIT